MELPLLGALSNHLQQLICDPRIKTPGHDLESITKLTNDLFPEITMLTQAISALAAKVNGLGESS
jgi:hypothetical protein